MDDVTQQPRGETSRLSAFLQGVFWTFVGYSVFRACFFVTGGMVVLDPGLVVFFHLAGGFLGLVLREAFRTGKSMVREVYREGRGDGRKDRPDQSPPP